jgi:hypothetical protein
MACIGPSTVQLYAMHEVKNILMLHSYLYAQFFALFGQQIPNRADFRFTATGVNYHDHSKKSLQYGLADVQNINIGLSQDPGNASDNANSIMPEHRDNKSFALFQVFAS